MKYSKPIIKSALFLVSIIITTSFFSAHSASADITTSLVSHYKMDEISGTTAADSAGTNTGTITGATFVTGKINNALSFNGTTNYASAPRMNYDEITVSAWFYKNANDTTSADAIFGGWYWNSNAQLRQGFDLRFYNTINPNIVSFVAETKNSAGTVTELSNYYTFADSTNGWHHLAGAYDKTTGEQKLYINGSLVSTRNHPVGNTIVPQTNYTDIRIGYSRVNNGYFNGKIDDVRFYNRALVAADIVQLYNDTGASSSSQAQSSSSVVVQQAPTAATNSATNIAQTSTTLNATVNNNGLTTLAWFQYGVDSTMNAFSTAPTQTINSLGDIAINSAVSSLSPSTVYYYRLAAQSNAGTTYGTVQSFTTLPYGDISAPAGLITINSGAETAISNRVLLNLSASDNLKATHYYISESSPVPSLSDPGWKDTYASGVSFSDNKYFHLSFGDGAKTVYAWYKDATGNISNVSSDSIVLNKNDSWKNNFSVVWGGSSAEIDGQIKYAKQVGYDYIALRPASINKDKYKANTNKAGLKFYIVNPMELQAMDPVIGTTNIFMTKEYTDTEKEYINSNFTWKSADAFPNNLASGWWDNPSTFRVRWDYQQQRVIDYVISQIISLIDGYEDKDAGFTFGGWMVDTPRIKGDFNSWDGDKNSRIELSELTGTGINSGVLHDSITHEYSTYDEGKAAFYKKLNAELIKKWPDSKSFAEPFYIYHETHEGDWLKGIKDRTDRDDIRFDFLLQESYGTQFVDTGTMFNLGMNITKDMVGSSQAWKVEEELNRLYAAKAGTNGSWNNWWGIWGNRGTMPNFQSLLDVYPRLKLIRLIPNWDNLRNIPLSQRTWNNSATNPIYSSKKNSTDPNPTSYFDSHVMYSRQWKNNKLFAVFNDNVTPIKLNSNETISSIQCVDGYFIESGDCANNFTVTDTSTGKQLTLKSTVTIPTDSSNSQIKGLGYIIATVVGSSSSSQPPSSSVPQSSSSATPSSSSAQSSYSSAVQSSSSISSSKFQSGDRVTTTDLLNVRSTASLTGTLLGNHASSSLGTIVSGPVSSGGYNWYNVNFDSAPDGWSVDAYLEKVQSSSSSSVSSATQTPQSSAGNTCGGGWGGGGGGGIIPQSSSSASSSSRTQSSSHSSSATLSQSLSSASPLFSSGSQSSAKAQTITEALSFGSRSIQVKTLQEMLATDKTIYPERLVTGYYGQLTGQAVKRFQTKHNLEITGLVNIQTKDKLNEIYGKTPQTSSSIKTTALTEAQKQELIKQLQAMLKQLLQQLIELLKEKAGR